MKPFSTSISSTPLTGSTTPGAWTSTCTRTSATIENATVLTHKPPMPRLDVVAPHVEAIVRAKGEQLDALLPPGTWAVLPSDEPRLAPHASHLPAARRVFFGDAEDDDVSATEETRAPAERPRSRPAPLRR